jgi:hypothetical protein
MSCVPSMEDLVVSITFSIVTEEEDSQEDWSAVVVEETESLPEWETKVHPNDDGWDTSLAKRECCLL